jgi:hypothetical protein
LNALYRVGDVLCLLAGDYCFRLERPSHDCSHERSPLKRAKADTQAAEGEHDPVDLAKRRRLENESSTQQGEDGSGGERNVKQDTHDGAARTGPGERVSHRRAGSELVPLEFEFGEHGATVKVLDLTPRESDDDASPVSVPARTALSKRDQDKAVDDVAGVLPHLPPDQIRKVLAKLGWNVEAAIDTLLSVGETSEGDEQPELVIVDDDEADLAGELVSSNSFAEAEPYFHLNWLPKYAPPSAYSLRFSCALTAALNAHPCSRVPRVSAKISCRREPRSPQDQADHSGTHAFCPPPTLCG